MVIKMNKNNNIKIKSVNKVTPGKILVYIILSALVLVYILPLLWMISVSLKTNKEIFQSPFAMPEVVQLGNYIFAWTNGKLGTATLNSVIVCAVALIMSMLIGAMAAFAIGRMKFRFSGAVMGFFMIGMMVPVHCVLIPLFVRFSKLHLTNSLVGLMIPYITFSLPMTIF